MERVSLKMFNFVVLFQLILFFIMVVLNYDSLDSVSVVIDLQTNIPFSPPQIISDIFDLRVISFSMNLYLIGGGLLFMVGLSLITSVSIIDTGLNEVGTSTVATYSYFFAFFFILQVPIFVYILPLGTIGLVISIVITLVWIFRGVELMHDKELD